MNFITSATRIHAFNNNNNNGYENIDSNIFFEIKESKITRGHTYTLVKKQSRLDVRKYSFSQRSMYGITYQLIVYMLVVLICPRTK